MAALYRRRAFCLTTGWAVAGLSLALAGAVAQQSPPAGAPPASQTSGTSDTSSQDKKQAKKPDKSILRIVPQPRRAAAGGQASGGPAGAQSTTKPSRGIITITPNGVVPPPGGPPGFPPGGPGGMGAPFNRGGNGGAPFFGGGTNSAPFSFDFHGADIQNVLQFFSKMSGMTITADQSLTGPVTIINPKPVTLDEAFKVLQNVLLVRGFSAVQSGNVLRIIPLDRAVTQSDIVNSGLKEGISQVNPRDQVMTQVIPLANVDADSMARELQPLINKGASLIASPATNSLILTDTASNVERFIKLAAALDKTSDTTEMRVYPLKRAEATGIADLINNVYRQKSGGSPTVGGPMPGGPQGMPMPQPPMMPGMPGASRPAVLAIADPRTNSVLVVASRDNQEEIAQSIINTLDGDESNTLQTKIRKILYADSDKVADLVNSVLSNMHGEATSSPTSQNQQRRGGFGGFFGGFGGFNNNQTNGSGVTSTDPLAKVVSDPRTNSVLITASADRMVQIDQLIDQIDVKVPVEATTFVIPLKNANAEDVASALGQAFNTANSNSGYTQNYYFGGNGNNNNGNSRRQQINRRLGGSGNSSGGFGGRSVRRGTPPGPPNAPEDDGTGDNSTDNSASAMPEGIQGVMTSNGFVPTQTDTSSDPNNPNNKKQTRQFFGFGFGGRQSGLGQSNSPTYGRGQSGAYVNYLQLQGNVFVTPSPGGDSIIVTTTPDNLSAVQQIVNQLDVLPRQVLIEAIVAEISLNSDEKLGFNLNALIHRIFHTNLLQTQIGLAPSGAAQGTTLDATQPGLQGVLTGTNYSALLQALSQDSKIKVLSTPRIFTANNQQADFEVTTNQPYISGQVTGNFTTTVANTVQYQQIGLIMNVTPRITREGQVTIDVTEEASDLLNYLTLGTGTNALSAPVFDDRYADTEVTVQDGQTVVIGGLIQDRHETDITKVPLLSDIPLIGQFFRGREKKHNREELMIFLTPHVVNTVDQETDLTSAQSGTIGKDMPEVKNEIPQFKNRNTNRPAQPNSQTPTPPNNGGQRPPANNGGQQAPPVQTPPGSGG